MNYKYFMVPGILVILVTMVGSILSALNIVKEKEIGTIEQINVTPYKKVSIYTGKTYSILGFRIDYSSIGLLISRLAYGIIPAGSLFTIYAFAGVYLLAVLGLGLLVSTIHEYTAAGDVDFIFHDDGVYSTWRVIYLRRQHAPLGADDYQSKSGLVFY